MFIHIISDCIFLFPTHVGKLLPLFNKKKKIPVSNLKPGSSI